MKLKSNIPPKPNIQSLWRFVQDTLVNALGVHKGYISIDKGPSTEFDFDAPDFPEQFLSFLSGDTDREGDGSDASGRYNLFSIGNTLGTGWNFDDDDAAIDVNYSGYQGGHTRYRGVNIYDGKGNLLLSLSGSDGSLSLDGYLGVGVSTPSYSLDVYENRASGEIAKFFNDGNNLNRYGIVIQCGKDTPVIDKDCRWIRYVDGNGTTVGYTAYAAAAPNVAYFAVSDRRLKENIRKVEPDSLSKLKGVTFNSFDWKPDENGNRRQSQKMGLVAQELREVLPECVGEDPDGMLSVNEGPLVKHLVRAVQQQQEQIEKMQDTIDELRGKLDG